MHPDNWISSAEDLLDEIGRAGDQHPSEETIEDLHEQWANLNEKYQETYDNELTTQDQKIIMDDLAYAIRGDLVGLRRFVSFESLVRLQRIARRGGRRSKRTRRGRKVRKARKTRKAQKRRSPKARGRRAIQFL
jgi:hypothetical protein